MNKVTLSILVGTASAVVGAVAGYFTAAKILDNRYSAEYEKRLNDELDRIRESNKRRFDEKSKQSVQVDRKVLEDLGIVVDNGQPLKVPSSTVSYSTHSTDHPPFGELTPEDEPDEEEIEYDENGNPVDSDEVADEYWCNDPDYWDDKPATTVSVDVYNEELPSTYDFVTFKYFTYDDTLIDDGDRIIDDVEHIVGDALTIFGEEAAALSHGDPDVVYVVNGKMNLAIEITRINKRYVDYLGMGG